MNNLVFYGVFICLDFRKTVIIVCKIVSTSYIVKKRRMKRHVSICQVIDCLSTSGSRISLKIREPLNSFLLHFYGIIETDNGSFKSCIMRLWAKEILA